MPVMKHSFTRSPSVAVGKKRGGINHRVRKLDPPPWPNDWLEWVIIGVALLSMAGGAYFFYAVGQ